ncbi:MAG: hypothetical protein ACK4PK_11370 [Alphaproteobacteria bacterium]
MLEKIKNIWANPYYAPLTEPLGNVGRTVRKSISLYLDAAYEGFRAPTEHQKKYSPRYYEQPRLKRVLGELMDDAHGDGWPLLNGLGMVIGGAVAGIAGAVPVWGAMGGAGMLAQVLVAGAAGVAAGTLGVMAAPVVLATTIAAGAAIVGVVTGVVPGLIGGTMKAIKHHKDLKNPPPPAATPAIAAVLSAQQSQNLLREQIKKDFDGLDKQNQRRVILELERATALTPQEKVLAAVHTLSEDQRISLLEAMEQKIGSAFDAVARKKAAEAAALEGDISVQPIATKLKRRNAEAPGGTSAG